MRRLVLRVLGITVVSLEIHEPPAVAEDTEDDAEVDTPGADASTVINSDSLPPMFGFTPFSTSREDWFE